MPTESLPASAAGQPPPPLPPLRADCGNCAGLCCVVPAFSASADFAIDKPAMRPCPHLRPDFRCSIHDQLRPRGFTGCAVYDCFGAGQQVTQVTFGGADWRKHPELAGRMFESFPIMRLLHELLWLLSEALSLEAAAPLRARLTEAVEATGRLAHGSAADLAAADVAGHRESVNSLLLHASELARGQGRRPGRDYRGVDLMGRDLRRVDLRAASLRGACLVRADLRGADLGMADFTGADLRAADLRGADLSGAIFLSQSQLEAARGDAQARLPANLTRSAHWQG